MWPRNNELTPKRTPALLLFLLASLAVAKDYPQSGTLKAVELADKGQSCTQGLLAEHCSPDKERHYRIETSDLVYVLKADLPIVQDDPLRALEPGATVNFRIDEKGNIWIAAPEKKKPNHEAKYRVLEKSQR